MTTCSSSFRAICLGLALLAAKASADRRLQPQGLATLESLPMFSGSLSHHGVESGDNEYDRGQEYMLAMPESTQPSPPTGTFETDSYTDNVDTTEGEDADRGPWKGVWGASPTSSHNNVALHFDGATSEYAGTRHWAGAGAGADVREYLRHGLPVATATEQPSEQRHVYSADVDTQAVLRKFLEPQRTIVGQTYDEDSDAVMAKYLEQQEPITQTYNLESDSALRQYFEQQKPIVSHTYNLDSDSVLRKYFEHQEPVVTKTTEFLSNPIVRNSYSIKPVYNVLPAPVIKKYSEIESAPVVRKPVTILPPPIVRKLYKVMPAPVIQKYYTTPPVVQSVKASPPTFNKFVKNIFVQHPFVVVPPPTKNVYNLIKLAAPTPKPSTPVPTTPVPTTPVPTTDAPTTAAFTNATPPLKAEPLVAQTAEAAEEATEEQKLKSVGKMVVVETVRRVVDVPVFDGPAPPPAHSEETVVEPDGTVRKFEKYIEYDQVSGNQQTAAVRPSHNKKSSKSSYAAQVSPDLVDDAATAASPAAARLLHSSAFFPAPGTFFSRLGGSSFDSMARTQFAKALIQPTNDETAAEDVSEQIVDGRMDAKTLEKGAEHLELPSETVAHLTTKPPALHKETTTVLPFP